MVPVLILAVASVLTASSLPRLPSAMGNLSTTTATVPNVGGFKAGPEPRNQDVYLVYPMHGPGNYPLVAFAHGCCKTSVDSSHTDYASLFTHLASNGIVVAVFNSCLGECPIGAVSGDQLHLVTALSQNTSLHPILTTVDFSRVVLMGHSMGGGATVDSAAWSAAPVGVTIRASVAVDPAPGLKAGSIKVPTFFACGQNDTIVPCWSVHLMYAAAPKVSGRHVYAVLRNAGHCDIQKPLPGSVWDVYIVAFVRCHLGTNHNSDACQTVYGDRTDSLCTAGYMVACEIKDKGAQRARSQKIIGTT